MKKILGFLAVFCLGIFIGLGFKDALLAKFKKGFDMCMGEARVKQVIIDAQDVILKDWKQRAESCEGFYSAKGLNPK